MITQKTIDSVLNDSDIVKVIEKVTPLKKKGANYSGCCPFHDEKTPSFSVSPSKGIFKCFGCGIGGNVVSFVMEQQRIGYPEAIRHLAAEFNIIVEETTEEKEDKEVKEKRLTMLDINKDVSKKYREALMDLPIDHWAANYVISDRKLTFDSLISFQIGYAPDSWDFVSKKIVDSGFYAIGEEMGIINKNDKARIYDVFRERIIFPIHNERGEVIAFSGRKKNDDKKENPKYINSKDSMVYRKSSVLYGLWQAQKTIRKLDYAILVEGNIDVIMMHQAGVTNTIAACGTAFTESHAQKLRRYCSKVIIMNDGDEAGQKATLKTIDVCLMAGLTVQVVQLEDKWDPDTLVQSIYPECCIEKTIEIHAE
ncbi:DNA primase [Sphingobacterium spiritivorum]|uniref:DNA primase n=1 Tax=Sphingobacterium spiritivorum TaxID=258 RepID=UPI003DA4697F